MKLPFALPLYKKTRLLTKGFGPQYPQKGVRGQTSLAGASLHPPGGGQGTAFLGGRIAGRVYFAVIHTD